MVLIYKTPEGKLRAREVIDMDFDMRIEPIENSDKYHVLITKGGCYIPEEFVSEEEAENHMYALAEKINTEHSYYERWQSGLNPAQKNKEVQPNE